MSARGEYPRRWGGFTLLEVMIGVALLGAALTVLVHVVSGNSINTRSAQLMGIATDLSRGKMYEIEEILLKDGYTDTTQMEENLTFEDEGWPQMRYSYKVEQVELPGWDALQAMAKQQAEQQTQAMTGSGAGSGSDAAPGGFENSMLGGLLSQLGGGLAAGAPTSADIGSSMGAAFIQQYYNMVQDVLKASVRKVTLIVTYDTLTTGGKTTVAERCPWDTQRKQCSDRVDNDGDGNTDLDDGDCYSREDDSESEQIVCMRTVAFFTDAAAMDKVLSGLGRTDLDDVPSPGTGSGTPTPGRGSSSGGIRGGGGGAR